MRLVLLSITLVVLSNLAHGFSFTHLTGNFFHTQNDGNENEKSLILLHVLFRHGNRTADSKEELYPTDPYYNKTYFPTGLGQLTNAGKVREYNIGKTLRDRYNAFLGNVIYPQLVDARTTDVNRTKISLLYCMAGLFPPRGEQIWNRRLDWQAVPYNYWPRNKDKILQGTNCKRYKTAYNEQRNSEQQQSEYAKEKELMEYISKHSGLNVTSFQDVYRLYFGVSTEDEYGLELPDWLKKIWPDDITRLAIKEYDVATATTELRQMASGYLLQKMVADTKSKIKEDPDNEFKKKIYLYSAHESTMAHFLITLDIFNKPHVPNYGSHIILEIHKIDGVYGVKVYYQNWTTDKPKLMKLPACKEFCPLDDFEELYEEYFPSEDLCDK